MRKRPAPSVSVFNQGGQGLIEYSLVLVLVLVVAIVILSLITGGSLVSKPTATPSPPAMNAPLLDIVRYCEINARESYQVTATRYDAARKRTVETQETRWRDTPDLFTDCLLRYEYTFKGRGL